MALWALRSFQRFTLHVHYITLVNPLCNQSTNLSTIQLTNQPKHPQTHQTNNPPPNSQPTTLMIKTITHVKHNYKQQIHYQQSYTNRLHNNNNHVGSITANQPDVG